MDLDIDLSHLAHTCSCVQARWRCPGAAPLGIPLRTPSGGGGGGAPVSPGGLGGAALLRAGVRARPSGTPRPRSEAAPAAGAAPSTTPPSTPPSELKARLARELERERKLSNRRRTDLGAARKAQEEERALEAQLSKLAETAPTLADAELGNGGRTPQGHAKRPPPLSLAVDSPTEPVVEGTPTPRGGGAASPRWQEVQRQQQDMQLQLQQLKLGRPRAAVQAGPRSGRCMMAVKCTIILVFVLAGVIAVASDLKLDGLASSEASDLPNGDCKGEWSRCSFACDRTWIEVRPRSGSGTPCPSEPPCAAGWGDCTQSFEWRATTAFSACTATCGPREPVTRKVTCVEVTAVGQSLALDDACVADENPGDTRFCQSGGIGESCDDSDDETTGDICHTALADSCAGKVILASSVSFDIAIDDTELSALSIGTTAGDTDRHPIAADAKASLAATLSSAGMTVSAADITILSIAAGSLVIEYSVEVLPSLATPQLRAASAAAVVNPTTVGLPADAMALTVATAAGVTIQASSAVHADFKSYSWVLRSACPAGACSLFCNATAIFRGPGGVDEYACLEDGTEVDATLCETAVGSVPDTTFECCEHADLDTCDDDGLDVSSSGMVLNRDGSIGVNGSTLVIQSFIGGTVMKSNQQTTIQSVSAFDVTAGTSASVAGVDTTVAGSTSLALTSAVTTLDSTAGALTLTSSAVLQLYRSLQSTRLSHDLRRWR